MLPQEILLQLFLFDTLESIFALIENKDLGIKLLNRNNSKSLLFLWKRDPFKIKVKVLLEHAFIDGNDELINILRKLLDNNNNFEQLVACMAVKYNQINILEEIIKLQGDNLEYSEIAKYAAKNNNEALVDHMVKLSSDYSYDGAAYGAACENHEELFYNIVSFHMMELEYILIGAIKGGNIGMIDHVLDHMEVGFEIDKDLIFKGNKKTALYLLQKINNETENILIEAASHNCKYIIDTLLDISNLDQLNKVIEISMKNNHSVEDLIKFCKNLEILAYYNMEKTGEMPKEMINLDWYKLACYAAKGYHIDVMKNIISKQNLENNFRQLVCDIIYGAEKKSADCTQILISLIEKNNHSLASVKIIIDEIVKLDYRYYELFINLVSKYKIDDFYFKYIITHGCHNLDIINYIIKNNPQLKYNGHFNEYSYYFSKLK